MVYTHHYILTVIIVCDGLSDFNFQYAFYNVIKGERTTTSNFAVNGISKLACSVLCTSRNDCCMAAYDTVNLDCHLDVSGSCCLITTSAVGWHVITKEKFGCECGWLQHGNSCYYVHTDKMTWSAAQSFCATRGSQLLKINDQDENDWIYSTVGELSYVSGTYFWIAAIRDPGGDIVWQDSNAAQSSISYSNWRSGEPNGPAGVADCAGVYISSGEWDDILCGGSHTVVCKKKLKAEITM